MTEGERNPAGDPFVDAFGRGPDARSTNIPSGGGVPAWLAATLNYCSRCGTEFTCNPAGACWCAQETVKLPMPVTGEDCLCRDCLRRIAAQPRREGRGNPVC